MVYGLSTRRRRRAAAALSSSSLFFAFGVDHRATRLVSTLSSNLPVIRILDRALCRRRRRLLRLALREVSFLLSFASVRRSPPVPPFFSARRSATDSFFSFPAMASALTTPSPTATSPCTAR